MNDGVRLGELAAGHTAEQLAKRMAATVIRGAGRQPAPGSYPARARFAHQRRTF